MLTICIEQQLGTLSLTVDVEIEKRGITAIFGRSGAGKSSLINLIAGLSHAAKGKIILNGRVLFDASQGIDLAPEKRQVGYVFQEARLFPHYTVEKNLKYGYKRSDPEYFLQIAHLLDIVPLLSRYPNSLSGGEKQRVAIGRALLSDPDILLMDEPLSALDLPRKNELLDYLSKLASKVQIPILYVSHSLDEIIRLADNILLLDQGNVTAFGRTAQVWNSAAFSAWQPEFQKLSLLELPLIEAQPRYKMLALGIGTQRIWINQPPHHQHHKKFRITIASRDVSISKTPPTQTSIRNILEGTLCKISPKSDRLDIAVQVADHQIWATISLWAFDELQLTEGEKVFLQIKSVSI